MIVGLWVLYVLNLLFVKGRDRYYADRVRVCQKNKERERERENRKQKPSDGMATGRQDDNDVVVVGGGVYHITHDNMRRKRLREMP